MGGKGKLVETHQKMLGWTIKIHENWWFNGDLMGLNGVFSVQNPGWLMIIGDYTTQYTGIINDIWVHGILKLRAPKKIVGL